MNTILLALLLMLCAPIIVKVTQILNIKLSENQFELLLKIIEKAVSHVHQISLNRDLTSENKKELAIEIANKLANKSGIKNRELDKIPHLIESVLWQEEDEPAEDEEDIID